MLEAVGSVDGALSAWRAAVCHIAVRAIPMDRKVRKARVSVNVERETKITLLMGVQRLTDRGRPPPWREYIEAGGEGPLCRAWRELLELPAMTDRVQ